MIRLFTLCLLLLADAAHADENPDWRAPLAPFQIADNLYYVGSRDLAAYLVTTPKGNILINANLAGSPPLIRASIEKLGFRWSDTVILLNSHAHSDHVGGAAEILGQTHAENMVMEGDADVVESGGRTDFLTKPDSPPAFASAHVDRVLHDGDTVALGGITLTAHKTPGHTRGCTTWTLRAHLPGEPMGRLRNVAIVGGVYFWSEYHFVDRIEHAASYPGIAADFRQTFATLHALPCDVFLGAHGIYFDLLGKLSHRSNKGFQVWIDPNGYKAFIDEAEVAFNTTLAKQLQEAKQYDRRKAACCASFPSYRAAPGSGDAAGIKSCFLLWKDGVGELRRQPDDACKLPLSPASTFKVPHALAALDAGVVTDPGERMDWDGTGQWAESARRSHTMASAMRNSVVWYFQRIAQRLGMSRETEYLRRFAYGNQDPSSGLTSFWLGESLLVTPDEQLAFWVRLYNNDLPVSEASIDAVKRMLVQPRNAIFDARGEHRFVAPWPSDAVVSAKPGSVVDRSGRGIRWLVGHVSRGKQKFTFVCTVVGPADIPADSAIDLAGQSLRDAGVL